MTRNPERRRPAGTLRKAAQGFGFALALGCAAVAGAADPATYEASYRYRLKNESCLKDEAQFGARCAKPCNPGYRIEEQGATPVCRRKN